MFFNSVHQDNTTDRQLAHYQDNAEVSAVISREEYNSYLREDSDIMRKMFPEEQHSLQSVVDE